MRAVTTTEDLEALVGTRPLAVMMKPIESLDDGCRAVLAQAPVAGVGYRGEDGRLYSSFVGGAPGFARVDSPTRVTFDPPAHEIRPAADSGMSLVFLLPGIGETLRVTGVVADRSDDAVAINLQQAWVHCAKCVLRSRLWDGVPEGVARASPDAVEGDGPLADPVVIGFLSGVTFLVISSTDGRGGSDTSPKGDHAGFVRVLDGRVLAIPDRKGNRRTDTFHNLLERDELSLAALVPGRDDVLHLGGTGYVTDDAALLPTLGAGAHAPKAALIVQVDRAQLIANVAVGKSMIWDASTRVDTAAVPDLMALGGQHIARNKARGAQATVWRALSKGLAAAPSVLRWGVNKGYDKELHEEGF